MSDKGRHQQGPAQNVAVQATAAQAAAAQAAAQRPAEQSRPACKHMGYLMKNGLLVCADCGAPSQSAKWRSNVFGAEAAKQMAAQTVAQQAAQQPVPVL